MSIICKFTDSKISKMLSRHKLFCQKSPDIISDIAIELNTHNQMVINHLNKSVRIVWISSDILCRCLNDLKRIDQPRMCCISHDQTSIFLIISN